MVFILNTGTGSSWLWLCALLPEAPWDAVDADKHCMCGRQYPKAETLPVKRRYQETWWHEAWILATNPVIDSKMVFVFILARVD